MKFSEYEYVQAKYYSGRRGAEIDTVILHYTAGKGEANRTAKFFAGGSRKASAHFCVSRGTEEDLDNLDSLIVQCVDTDLTSWHAGKSSFMGKSPVGRRSIGLELCNTGWAYTDRLESPYRGRHRNPKSRMKEWEPYKYSQIKALESLLKKLVEAHPTLKYISGHEDIRHPGVVSGLKGAKLDPSPAFPWETLDTAGLIQMHWNFKTKQWEEGIPKE